jgi:hypothetical protein
MYRRHRLGLCAAMALFAMAVPLAAVPTEAGWIKGLGSLASKGGAAKAGKLGLGLAALEAAATHVGRLPSTSKLVPLAAHATPEGHWSFVNKNGEVFTAANADEMARLGPTLAPGLEADGKLAFYLSEDTALNYGTKVKSLPESAELHIVSDSKSFLLLRKDGADGPELSAQVRPNVVVDLKQRDQFSEALAMLARPLNKANVRMLSLEADGPKRLSSVATFDKTDKTTLVDRLDPASLPAAMTQVRGQTVLVTGVVDGDALHVLSTGVATDALSITALRDAAAAADVNLIILQQASTRQPGGRNWLWQKVGVPGLDVAVKQTQFADFLNVLGETRGQMSVTTAVDGYGRTLLQAVPTTVNQGALQKTLGPWAGDVADELRGSIAIHALTGFLRDSNREKELDARFIPGIPSEIQIFALVSFVVGLISYEVSWTWWGRIWPTEDRSQYGNSLGYQAARGARLLGFLMLFLPLFGSFAFLKLVLIQLWHAITAPVRWWRWLRGKFAFKKIESETR